MSRPRGLSLALLTAPIILAGAIAWWVIQRVGEPAPPAGRVELGLFSTLPVYWGEADELSELLDGSTEPHWARAAIEREFALRPVDLLTPESLARFDAMLLAQPRALSPAENVALDGWVRRGGRLLLFADPMLTGQSRFMPGDPRRPVDGVLLSPILGHWGLELVFDPSQRQGERTIAFEKAVIPVEMAGRFVTVALPGNGLPYCALAADNIVADCRIGRGRAVIVADAALLDGDGADVAARAAVLRRLLEYSLLAG